MKYNDENPAGTTKPLSENASILKPYSIGLAATNMIAGQTDLEVVPIEKLNRVDGEVTDNVTTQSTSGIDASGSNYSDNVDTSLSIKAKWLSRNSWLHLPGLVRRGEQVQIWRVGDTDQYYWELLGTTNHLRRLDILLLVISNTKEEATQTLTPNNAVFFEVNTNDKHITLSTPKNDGEPASYTIQLNMKEGNFSLSDDLGNALVLNSVDAHIHFQNSAGAFLKIHQQKIEMFAVEEIKMTTEKLIVNATDATFTGKTAQHNYTNLTMTGAVGKLEYDTLNLNGSALGLSFAKTSASSGGSFSIQTTSFTHNGKNVGDSHSHSGVRGGSESSGPPE